MPGCSEYTARSIDHGVAEVYSYFSQELSQGLHVRVMRTTRIHSIFDAAEAIVTRGGQETPNLMLIGRKTGKSIGKEKRANRKNQ